jgi:hypothetical protein
MDSIMAPVLLSTEQLLRLRSSVLVCTPQKLMPKQLSLLFTQLALSLTLGSDALFFATAVTSIATITICSYSLQLHD